MYTSSRMKQLASLVFAGSLFAASAQLHAQGQTPPAEAPADWGPVSSTLEEVPYPHPVHYLDVQHFGQDGRMAYMDVAPTGTPNGQTAMLFHGMNFAGKGFEVTITALSEAGFRVLVPDRIGYGRSSKLDIPYNLHIFALDSKRLLDHVGVEKAAIVGHSMGGMVASRFAMTYPAVTTHVALVNQIGLTDQRQGRPWRDFEELYQATLTNTTYQSILRNHMSYYPTWDNKYLEWVRYQYGQTLIAEWPLLARIRTWQQQILFLDPVVYDWQHIQAKSLVIGGAQDNLTANYAELARHVSETIPNAELILYPGIGHNPHFEIPEQYHADLIRFLRSEPLPPPAD
jgi:pimeloyl-ACP methyl ester carboxylesterase